MCFLWKPLIIIPYHKPTNFLHTPDTMPMHYLSQTDIRFNTSPVLTGSLLPFLPSCLTSVVPSLPQPANHSVTMVIPDAP